MLPEEFIVNYWFVSLVIKLDNYPPTHIVFSISGFLLWHFLTIYEFFHCLCDKKYDVLQILILC